MTESQTPPTSASPETTTPPAPQAPAKPAFDFKKCLGNLSLVEKILGVIAVLVILGCFLEGSAFWKVFFFKQWFYTLAFLGSLAIVAIVALKALEVRYLPPPAEKKLIAIVSLVPVVGLLISMLNSIPSFLTLGGSLALAYISATTFWQGKIPEFAKKPLGSEPDKTGAPGSSSAR